MVLFFAIGEYPIIDEQGPNVVVHGNMKNKTDKEKTISYTYFQRFHDSGNIPVQE